MSPQTKPDLYTKIVLTVIAACLVWLCLHNVPFTSPSYAQELPAAGAKPVPVRIVEIAPSRKGPARAAWEPIPVRGMGTGGALSVQVEGSTAVPVRVDNWPKTQSVTVANWPLRIQTGWPPRV